MMLDGRGFVAETNATHLFAVVGGGLVTPRAVACPEGITRDTVLRLAADAGIAVEVRDVSQVEMYTADEVFCTGTMGEIAGVVTIDGRPIGTGKVGPLTTRLSQVYRQHAREHAQSL
jgi:branched-chain amino acid aminotransferase